MSAAGSGRRVRQFRPRPSGRPCCAPGRAAGSSRRPRPGCSPPERCPRRVRLRSSPSGAREGRWRGKRQRGACAQQSGESWQPCASCIIRVQPMRRNLSAYLSEFAGTAIMLFLGVSAVAFMWGPGSPVPVVPNAALRRLLTGIMFAGGATAVVYSPLGQISGGHLNPPATLARLRPGQVPTRDAVIYFVMQFLWAFVGAYAAGVAWGGLPQGVHHSPTLPRGGYTRAGGVAAPG